MFATTAYSTTKQQNTKKQTKLKTGILLINLGTPENCSTSAVRKYLKEFLFDPRVIDIPYIARWLLLNLVILPLRPRESAKAYNSIWSKHGSPLLVHTRDLAKKLNTQLGNNYCIEFGMRYGKPSIESAIDKLLAASVGNINIIPLFPQYSSAATGSAIEKAISILSNRQSIPKFTVLDSFYANQHYIDAKSQLISNTLTNYDHLLFSYHGIPTRQLNKLEQTKCCDRIASCASICDVNRYCYRAQCFATTAAIAKKLNLPDNTYSTSFQSRLGRTEWIKPYTDEVLPKLINNNVKNLSIVCPAFVADCLETLEEIGIRAKEQWKSLGGNSLQLIPCLNSNPIWVNNLAKIITEMDFKLAE